MATLIEETKPVARKQYNCDASWAWDNAGLSEADVTPEQWATAQAAKAEGYQILPGMQYRKCVYKDGGAIGTYRARLDMDTLACDLDLFDE